MWTALTSCCLEQQEFAWYDCVCHTFPKFSKVEEASCSTLYFSQIKSSILSILGATKAASAAAALLSAGRGIPQHSDAGNGKASAVKGPILPAVLATLVAVLALFLGLAIAILISRHLKTAEEGYTAFEGVVNMGQGLTMGMAAWMAGRLVSSATEADSGYAKQAIFFKKEDL